MMRRMILPLLALVPLAGCVVADGPGYYPGPVYSRPWGGGYAYGPPPRPVYAPPAYAWRAPPPRWSGPPPGRGWGGPPRGWNGPPRQSVGGPPPGRPGGGGGFVGRGDHNNGRGAEGGN